MFILGGEFDIPHLCMHDYSELGKMIVWASTNILLNSLCFEKSDEVRTERLSKGRKLNTLT